MKDGWIKLWRKLLDDPLFHTLKGDQFKIFISLLLIANWKEQKETCNKCGKTFLIPTGGFTTNTRKLAKAISVANRECTRVCTQRMLKMGFICTQRLTQCHGYYLINNYEKYQSDSEITPNVSPSVHPTSPILHPKTTQSPYIRRKEYKKNKNVQNCSLESFSCAGFLYKNILIYNPQHRIKNCNKNQLDKLKISWANDFDKLNRIDKVDWKDIHKVLEKLPYNDFWAKNIQSGAKFRKQWDRLFSDLIITPKSKPQQQPIKFLEDDEQ